MINNFGFKDRCFGEEKQMKNRFKNNCEILLWGVKKNTVRQNNNYLRIKLKNIMEAIEFKSVVKNGMIPIPEMYREKVSSSVRVIVLVYDYLMEKHGWKKLINYSRSETFPCK